MARPSLADSLRASLNKGAHVETAEKIARGFSDIPVIASDRSDSLTTDNHNSETVLAAPSPVKSRIPATNSNKFNFRKTQRSQQSIIAHSSTIPSDGHTVIPSDSSTVSQSHSITEIPSDRGAIRPSYGQAVAQSDGRIAGLQLRSASEHQTHYQTPIMFIPLEVLNLAYNQACVLEALIDNTVGITNYRAISEQTNISVPSVREAISRLVVKGFMHKPVIVKNAAFQGFSFVLNKSLCDHFITAGGLSQENYKHHQTVHQTVKQSNSTVVRQADCQTTHSSSKFYEDLKSTTTHSHQTVKQSDQNAANQSNILPNATSTNETIIRSDGFILTGAIGAYWEEEGLGEGQAQKWCVQFETPPDLMRQQLDWARYDLEVNGRRSEVKKDTVSWFFGHLRQTGGCFPRPVNYKSPLEIRADALEKELAQERYAKERLAAAEIEQKFQQILANPQSEEYQKLFNQINEFAKEEGGMALEHALRDVFLGE